MAVAIIAVAGLFMIRFFRVVWTATQASGSMAPTIAANSTVTIESFSYWFRNPQRGEIVVYQTQGLIGTPADQLFIKRVVGLPGEQMIISNGFLFVNGGAVTITNEFGPIIFHTLPSESLTIVTNLTIPTGSYFVIGDNASNSLDSRMHGPVPRAQIIGLVR
jgi:signal peptidase I